MVNLRANSPILALVSAAFVLAASITATAMRQGSTPAPQAKAPAEPPIQSDEELARVGEDVTTKACNTECHGLEKLDEMRRPSRDWNEIVALMVTKGAKATDQQLAIVKQYVKRYYGLVAVNTAPAAELSAVLGLSSKDAQAIVDYRNAHGRFADAAALSQVPGIDKTKIDEQPDALVFK